MGTRGLTKVIFNGQTKIAQYGQWDHYPSGVGAQILKFLLTPGNVDRLREKLPTVIAMSEEDIVRTTASQDTSRFLQFDRETGPEILDLAANGCVTAVRLDEEFEDDTIACEGVFTVDLDENIYTFREPPHRPSFQYSLDALPTLEEFSKWCQAYEA